MFFFSRVIRVVPSRLTWDGSSSCGSSRGLGVGQEEEERPQPDPLCRHLSVRVLALLPVSCNITVCRQCTEGPHKRLYMYVLCSSVIRGKRVALGWGWGQQVPMHVHLLIQTVVKLLLCYTLLGHNLWRHTAKKAASIQYKGQPALPIKHCKNMISEVHQYMPRSLHTTQEAANSAKNSAQAQEHT